ncbi:MAG TPA: SLATT domain-containing protein [Candidatus Saccharimonadales bacterium]|jgi:hypothetical protein|nr:SLATT domain-containing protein [Candidatus Saccharimonadales bacterium]
MRGKSSIKKEAERVHEAVMYSAQGQFEQAKIWNKRNTRLGIPATGLSAIAGVTGLATTVGRIPAGLMALLAAFLTSIMTTLNYARKIDQAHSSGNAYLSLQQDVRIFLEIDLDKLNETDAREQLSTLVARQQEINGTALLPSEKSYQNAKKNIKTGGQNYKADKRTK